MIKIGIVKLVIIFLFQLLLFGNLSGQNASIYGTVKYETYKVALDSIELSLSDSIGNKLYSVFTNQKGEYTFNNINKGKYNIETVSIKQFPSLITEISITGDERLNIPITVKDPCAEDQSKGICPKCKSGRKVLRISPSTVVSYNYGNNIKRAQKAWRKVERRGYSLYTNEDGEEIVISMLIESEHGKFYDFCHKWFCKRSKLVF